MGAEIRDLTKNSNLRGDQSVGSAPTFGHRSAKSFAAYQEELRKLIRDIWPDGTAKELAHAGNISVRQAERILGRQRKIPFEVFWSLMEHDEFGRRFHWAVLDHLTAKWSTTERHDREYIAIQNQKRALDEREEKWRKEHAT